MTSAARIFANSARYSNRRRRDHPHCCGSETRVDDVILLHCSLFLALLTQSPIIIPLPPSPPPSLLLFPPLFFYINILFFYYCFFFFFFFFVKKIFFFFFFSPTS